MTISRAIPLTIHAAIEAFAGPAIMVAPFLLGFGEAATIATVSLGVVLFWLAFQVAGPQRGIPLALHAGLDYVLATLAVIAGLAIGVASGEWTATVFLVGVGVALAALAGSTRFSAPSGAW